MYRGDVILRGTDQFTFCVTGSEEESVCVTWLHPLVFGFIPPAVDPRVLFLLLLSCVLYKRFILYAQVFFLWAPVQYQGLGQRWNTAVCISLSVLTLTYYHVIGLSDAVIVQFLGFVWRPYRERPLELLTHISFSELPANMLALVEGMQHLLFSKLTPRLLKLWAFPDFFFQKVMQ